MSQLKLGNMEVIFSTFKKYLKDNKHSLKYAGIFDGLIFPKAWHNENCSLLKTDNVHGQISEYIFLLNGGSIIRLLQTLACGSCFLHFAHVLKCLSSGLDT